MRPIEYVRVRYIYRAIVGHHAPEWLKSQWCYKCLGEVNPRSMKLGSLIGRDALIG